MRRRDILHGIYRVTAATLLSVTLLLTGLYFALHTRTGMQWLADKIKQATHQQVELIELYGRLPLEMHATALRLRDREGKVIATINQPSFRCSLNIAHAVMKVMAPTLADVVTGATTNRTIVIELSAPEIEDRNFRIFQAALTARLSYGLAHDPVSLHATTVFDRMLLGDKTVTMEQPITYAQTNQQGRLNLSSLRLNDRELSGYVNVSGMHAEGEIQLHHPRFETFTARARAGIRLFRDFLPAGIDEATGLDLHLLARGRLEKSGTELINAPVSVSGDIHADLLVRGLPRQPAFEGELVWRDGRFRNIKTGTLLEDISLALVGEGDELVLRNGEAFDDARGKLTMHGDVSFSNVLYPAWRLTGELDKITLFHLIRTELPLSGVIRIDGDPSGSTVKGNLKLKSSTFIIPRRLPQRMVKLPLVEINHPDPARNTPAAMDEPAKVDLRAKAGSKVTLDIHVDAREGMEISGRGLNSLWRGYVNIGGVASAPALNGFVNLSEGYVMVLGRRFQIESGRLDLDGSVPPKPRIHVDAATRISDVTVRVAVTGTTGRPQIRLASDPMLAEEDIMAMILFGKLTDTMSPWQAIALANGLRVITGQEGDITSVVDTGMELLQVDQLDIRQDEEGAGLASVAVGKHFGRRIYVEGEKGFGNAEDLFKVTLELTPRITLETESSPRIREGVGIYWRRDF